MKIAILKKHLRLFPFTAGVCINAFLYFCCFSIFFISYFLFIFKCKHVMHKNILIIQYVCLNAYNKLRILVECINLFLFVYLFISIKNRHQENEVKFLCRLK